MKISIITLFPDMISGFFEESILKRAIDKKLVEIEIINLRDFAQDRYKTVDDKPYGGGAGMILKVDILKMAIDKVVGKSKNKKKKVILTSPAGVKYTQKKAWEYSKLKHIIFVTGHYEGHDERIVDYVDEEISLGDFVLTGGEVVAAAIVDSIVRLLPKVLKKPETVQEESFSEVNITDLIKAVGSNKKIDELIKKGNKKTRLLEYPQYTRPVDYKGKKVPRVLFEGNHKKIKEWRMKKAFEVTLKRRPDLLE
ncbi:MAG: tRNA (guanosine(37)-N1)-methyltransferase TrmD [bacterium]